MMAIAVKYCDWSCPNRGGSCRKVHKKHELCQYKTAKECRQYQEVCTHKHACFQGDGCKKKSCFYWHDRDGIGYEPLPEPLLGRKVMESLPPSKGALGPLGQLAKDCDMPDFDGAMASSGG